MVGDLRGVGGESGMSDRLAWPAGRDEDAALIFRTDYDDERAWLAVKAALMTAWGDDDDFEPYVHIVDDSRWAGITPVQVLSEASLHAERGGVIYLADRDSMGEAPVTLLALSLLTREQCESDEEFEAYGGAFGGAFRVVPKGVHEMNANLMIANLDFGDFADAARDDPEGIFRGFANRMAGIGRRRSRLPSPGLRRGEGRPNCPAAM